MKTRRPSPSKRRAAVLVRLIVAALLIASPRAGSAFDGAGARTLELQRDLRSVRPRVDRAPRASAYELRNLERRLHDRQIDAPRDPRLPGLEIEARELRWQADRSARRRATAADLSRSAALTTGAPIAKPRYLGGAHAPPRAAAADFGQRVVALQREVAAIGQQLTQGPIAAARRLEAATAELAVLRGALSDAVADDPNLIALEGQLGALRQRLE